MAESPRASGVRREPISAASLALGLPISADGAVVCFEGRVRDRNLGRSVRALHYEAYEAMADEVLREIAEQAASRHGATSVLAQHRVGDLAPGDVSVVVVASAPHRDAAFAAAREAIEEVKRKLPVWKREEYADGSVRWLDGEPAPSGEQPASGAGTSHGAGSEGKADA